MTVEGRNLQMTGRLETGSGGRGQKTAGPWLGFVGDELERWWGRMQSRRLGRYESGLACGNGGRHGLLGSEMGRYS